MYFTKRHTPKSRCFSLSLHFSTGFTKYIRYEPYSVNTSRVYDLPNATTTNFALPGQMRLARGFKNKNNSSILYS
jgi:hypothetical protein